ncbi:MAG: hypothetical protein V4642_09950 [Bacteroidota bacterium]
MKNLILPFVVVALFAIGSCGDEGNPVTNIEQNAVKILSFTPDTTFLGTIYEAKQVIITGQNFSLDKDSNKVWFSPFDQAIIDSCTSTELFVRVPASALTGPIIVSNGRTVDTSEKIFKIVDIYDRKILDFYPKSGEAGTRVKIIGQNLTYGHSKDYMFVCGVKPVRASETEIEFDVTDEMKTGRLWIHFQAAPSLYSKDSFIVIERPKVLLDMALRINLSGYHKDVYNKITPINDSLTCNFSGISLKRYGDSLVYQSRGTPAGGIYDGSNVTIQLNPALGLITQLDFGKSYDDPGISPGSPKSGYSSSFTLKNIPFTWQDSSIVVSLDSSQTRSLITNARIYGYNQGIGGAYKTETTADTVKSCSGLNLKIKY